MHKDDAPAGPANEATGALPEVRWVLAALSPMMAIFIAILSLVAGPTWLMRFCPPSEVISGACVAPWYRSLETVVVSMGFGVAAALFVLLPTTLAPRSKRQVAMSAFLCGLALTVSIGVGLVPVPAAVAALVGGLAVVTIYRLHPSAA